MSKIYFNATGLSPRLRGIGTYTHNILKNWPDKKNTILIGPPQVLEQLGHTEFEVIESPLCKTTAERLSFLQFKLDKLGKQDFFFSPAPEAPFLIKAHQLGIVVHDLIPTLFPHTSSFALRSYFKYVVPKLAHRAKLLIVNSKNTAEDVKKYLKPKVEPTVVYCGVDEKFFHPPQNPTRDYFFCISHFDAHKNFESAISAVAQLRHSHPCRLIICGDSSTRYGQEIKDSIRDQNLNDIVEIRNHVTGDELLGLYGNARALIVASQYEGFGMPVTEALASKTPAVVRRVSSLPEVAGDVGIYFDTDAELVERLRDLLQKPSSPEFAEKLQSRARQFSWEKSAEQIYEAIQEIL